MFARPLRKFTVAVSVLAVLAAGSGPVSACCFWKSATTAYYAPAPVVAPACQTCNYVPQVAYRTVYTNVPVTSYRPITTVNPCTGCPVTALQPVTAYRLQPQLVPYTTYRPVMTSCCAAPTTVAYAPACPTCSPCAGGACGMAAPAATTYYAPAAVAAPAMVAPALPAAPAAPCCGGSAANTMAPMAAASYAQAPAPGYSVSPAYSSAGSTTYPAPSTPSSNPANTQPTLPAAGTGPSQSSPQSTFRPDSETNDSSNSGTHIPAIPDLNTSSAPQRSNMIIPRKTDNAGDLTASKALPGSGVYRHASAKVAIPANTVVVDQGQWRAAQ